MSVLIIEDDPYYARMLEDLLGNEYGRENVQKAGNLEEAEGLLEDQIPELIILDALFPRRANREPFFMADEFIAALDNRRRDVGEEDPDIILISNQNTAAEEENFNKVIDWLGDRKIKDVLPKTTAEIGLLFFQAILKHKVRELRRERALRLPLSQACDYLRGFNIYTKSDSMKKIGQHIKRVGPTNASVLITGESGTGKELIARAIHEASDRRNGPFVCEDCGALSPTLIESLIFGAKKGVYTGAHEDRPGFFEAANHGTLFLDEIGNLPLELQPKFLRVLQEKQVTRLGETKPRKVDIRIITATNMEISVAIGDKTFREDLYYRIAQFPIHLPPLRERLEDIELLIEPLLSQSWKALGKSKKRTITIADFLPEARRALTQYQWPGNVRELESLLGRVLTIFDAGPITVERLIEAGLPLSKIEISDDPEMLRKQLIAEIGKDKKPNWKRLKDEEMILKLLDESLAGKPGKLALDSFKTLIDRREKKDPQGFLVYKALLYLVLRSNHQTNYAELKEVLGRGWTQVDKVVNLAMENFKASNEESYVMVGRPDRETIITLCKKCL